MKRVFSIFILLFMVLICLIPFLREEQNVKSLVSQTVTAEKQLQGWTLVGEFIKESVAQDPIKEELDEIKSEMLIIDDISDRKEWYVAYKEVIEKYSNVLEVPKTIYDYYSNEEIEILQRIVEAECTNLDFDKKVNVANVILNRIASDNFPNTVKEVIFQNNPVQFSPVSDGRYYSVTPTDETLLAIEYAFMFPDTTGGALFFEAIWSKNLQYEEILNDGSHKFYKK